MKYFKVIKFDINGGKMRKVIKSQIIENSDEMNEIISSIEKLYDESSTNMLPNNYICDEYYYVKSHRSNVTEGNTTSIGEFTDLVKNWKQGDLDYVVINKPYDESYEISNLTSAFKYLETINELNLVELQNVHRILGKDIFKNNLVAVRGRLKRLNNYVDFSNKRLEYRKYFVDHEQVKNKLENFFLMWNNILDADESVLFAKFVILQTELISIHAFNDGNGRVSRAFAESYLEKLGYVPYTPYSVNQKRSYQEAMGEYSVISLSDKQEAYLYLARFMLSQYENNTNELITSCEKLTESLEK